MGIIEQLEAEQNRPPKVFQDCPEDKLEEWIGLVPEGTMKSRPPKPPEVGQITVDISLAKKSSDIYKPGSFKTAVQYARALKRHEKSIPSGYTPGFIVKTTLNGITHLRRISQPVKSKEEALNSAEFILAMTESIQAILEHKR